MTFENCKTPEMDSKTSKFRCSSCEEVFPTFESLVSHQNSLNHSGKTRTTSSFPKESNATKSVPALTPPKIAIQVPEKLSDKLSNEKFNMLISRMEQKNDENLPKLAHNISNQQLISCDLCENTFSSDEMLVSHKKEFHNQDEKMDEVNGEKNDEEGTNETVKVKKNLEDNSLHGTDITPSNTESNPKPGMENNVTNYVDWLKSSGLDFFLSKEIKTEEKISILTRRIQKSDPCELCNFVFKSRNSLEKRDHIYMKHFKQQIDEKIDFSYTFNPENPVSCPIENCDFKSPFYSDFAKNRNNAGLGQKTLKFLFNKTRRQEIKEHYIGINHNTLEKYIARELNVRLEKNSTLIVKNILNQEKLQEDVQNEAGNVIKDISSTNAKPQNVRLSVHRNEKSEKIFKCAKCDQTFNKKQDQKSHMKKMHQPHLPGGGIKSENKCNICDKTFEHFPSLKLHIKKMGHFPPVDDKTMKKMKIKLIRIDDSSSSGATPNDKIPSKIVSKTKIDSSPFEKNSLEDSSHEKISNIENNVRDDNRKKAKIHKCESCDKKFTSGQFLSLHYTKVHHVINEMEESGNSEKFDSNIAASQSNTTTISSENAENNEKDYEITDEQEIEISNFKSLKIAQRVITREDLAKSRRAENVAENTKKMNNKEQVILNNVAKNDVGMMLQIMNKKSDEKLDTTKNDSKLLEVSDNEDMTTTHKFPCIIFDIKPPCEETFKTDKELENHVLKTHSNAKLSKEDISDLLLNQYKKESDRLKTFKNCWPKSAISPEKFANAGFIYTGREDNVQCFSCAIVIGDWEDDDDPMVEHMKRFPKCPKFGCQQEKSNTSDFIDVSKQLGFRDIRKKENKNSSEENPTPDKDATTCDDIKNYACKYKKCDQTFSRESRLKSHVRQLHLHATKKSVTFQDLGNTTENATTESIQLEKSQIKRTLENPDEGFRSSPVERVKRNLNIAFGKEKNKAAAISQVQDSKLDSKLNPKLDSKLEKKNCDDETIQTLIQDKAQLKTKQRVKRNLNIAFGNPKNHLNSDSPAADLAINFEPNMFQNPEENLNISSPPLDDEKSTKDNSERVVDVSTKRDETIFQTLIQDQDQAQHKNNDQLPQDVNQFQENSHENDITKNQPSLNVPKESNRIITEKIGAKYCCELCNFEFKRKHPGDEKIHHLMTQHFHEKIEREIKPRIPKNKPFGCPEEKCAFVSKAKASCRKLVLRHYLVQHGVLKKLVKEELESRTANKNANLNSKDISKLDSNLISKLDPKLDPKLNPKPDPKLNTVVINENDNGTETTTKDDSLENDASKDIRVGGVPEKFSTKACELCDLEFNKNNRYGDKLNHMINYHFKERIECEVQPVLPSTSPFTCPEKNCSYFSGNNILNHYLMMHGILKKYIEEELELRKSDKAEENETESENVNILMKTPAETTGSKQTADDEISDMSNNEKEIFTENDALETTSNSISTNRDENNSPIFNQTLSPSSSENSNGSYRQKKQYLQKCETPKNHIPKITLMVNNKVANNPNTSKAICRSCHKDFSNLEMLPQDQIKHVTQCFHLMPFILKGFRCKFCKVSYRCGSLCLINHLEKIHEDQIREERIGNTNIKIESSENNPDVQEVITIINNSNPKNTPRPRHPNPNYNNQKDIDAPIQIVKKMRKRSRPTNTNSAELFDQEDSKENISVCDDSPRLKSRKLQINGRLYPDSLPIAPKIEPNAMITMDDVIDLSGDDEEEETIVDRKIKMTIVKVTRDQEKVPFVIEIPKFPVTLSDLKRNMPFKGIYRYFYKTYIDDEDPCFKQIFYDADTLPLFGDKIIVTCIPVL